MEKKRTQFSGKIGFILAAAGSAVGLGNIWRFPYLAAEYGGGTFLFFYILFAITFGFSLMIAEVGLGRKTGRGVVGTFQALDKRFTFMGWLTMLVPILTLPYYSVTGGWVMHYAMLFLTGQGAKTAETVFFQSFSANPLWPVFWLCIFVAISCIIVMFGVKKGIERTSKIFLPILIALNIAIAIYVMTLPGALDGVLYYITPDFSKLSFGTIIAALGQLFYSMSLAMGIMFTYGSYLNKKENLEASVRHIELFDTGIAFLSGLMILPTVFVFSGGDANVLNSGSSLLFITMPQVFMSMPFGQAVGAVFFILVFFAALTSAISFVETIVSVFQDQFGWKRIPICIGTCLGAIVIGLAAAWGFGWWSGFTIFGMNISDFLDFFTNSILMPISALFTCIFLGFIVGTSVVADEVKLSSRFRSEKMFVVITKWIAPVCIVTILITSILSAAGLFAI